MSEADEAAEPSAAASRVPDMTPEQLEATRAYLMGERDAPVVVEKEAGEVSEPQEAGGGGGEAAGGEAGTQGQLIAAVNKGDEEVVGKMLDERRAEVDMMDSGGATPLMLACHQGHPQLVQLLLDYNASVTARTTVARNSVMHFAAKNGSEAVIKILMERDATLLDSPNKNLDTPLMMAVLARNHVAAGCILKYSSKSLDYQNKSLNTALHLAAKVGDMGLVKLLMDHGANVTLRNDAGQTALDLARSSSQEDCVAYLEAQWRIIEETAILQAQELLCETEAEGSSKAGGGGSSSSSKSKKKKVKGKKAAAKASAPPKLQTISENGGTGGAHDDATSPTTSAQPSSGAGHRRGMSIELREDESLGRLQVVRLPEAGEEEDAAGGADGEDWNVVQKKVKQPAPPYQQHRMVDGTTQLLPGMVMVDRERERALLQRWRQKQLLKFQQHAPPPLPPQQTGGGGGARPLMPNGSRANGPYAARPPPSMHPSSTVRPLPSSSAASRQQQHDGPVPPSSSSGGAEMRYADALVRSRSSSSDLPASSSSAYPPLGPTTPSATQKWPPEAAPVNGLAPPSTTRLPVERAWGLSGQQKEGGAERRFTSAFDVSEGWKSLAEQRQGAQGQQAMGGVGGVGNSQDLMAAIASATGQMGGMRIEDVLLQDDEDDDEEEEEDEYERGRFSPSSQAPWAGSSIGSPALSDDEDLHGGGGPGSPSLERLVRARDRVAASLHRQQSEEEAAAMAVLDGVMGFLDDADEGTLLHSVRASQRAFESRFPKSSAVALDFDSLYSSAEDLSELSMTQLEVLRDILHEQMRNVEAAMIEQARKQERMRTEERLRVDRERRDHHPHPSLPLMGPASVPAPASRIWPVRSPNLVGGMAAGAALDRQAAGVGEGGSGPKDLSSLAGGGMRGGQLAGYSAFASSSSGRVGGEPRL